MNDLTPKAELTRQRILTTAFELFAQQGFEATTMREIAAAAEVSVGLAYRYFESKEAMVLALYQQMAAETDAAIAQLPAGTVADRFIATMVARLKQAAPYRETFGALFSAIMSAQSDADLLGAKANSMRQQAEAAFVTLVQESNDAPRSTHVQMMGKLLYGVHFAVIWFWMRDRSEGQEATKQMLTFVRDLLPWLLRGLALPPVAKQITRFISIMDGVLGTTP